MEIPYLPDGLYVTTYNPGDGKRYRLSWQEGDYFAVRSLLTGSYREAVAFAAGVRAERERAEMTR